MCGSRLKDKSGHQGIILWDFKCKGCLDNSCMLCRLIPCSSIWSSGRIILVRVDVAVIGRSKCFMSPWRWIQHIKIVDLMYYPTHVRTQMTFIHRSLLWASHTSETNVTYIKGWIVLRQPSILKDKQCEQTEEITGGQHWDNRPHMLWELD
jgi:hypothetical protein